ncbi:MAG: peptidase domain-containing ABC transporter [Chitinophagales bacterium]|jgi:ATP-binding cassette subfamily B protein|nr:peptidase domain-containing ABC transporter [Sphingobacteriales bacterium]
MPLTFPLFKQLDAMDCGATCLRMVAKWYGKTFDGKFLRELSYTGREGVSLAGLSRAAESIGFKTLAVKVDIDTLVTDAPLPCVLHWNQNHFVVLYATNVTNWHKFLGLFKTKEWLAEKQKFQIADPAHGKIKLSFAELKKNWATNDKNEGVALLLETTPSFYEAKDRKEEIGKTGVWKFIYPYFKPYNRYVGQLFLGLLIGTLLSFIFPFLTQSIVDIGIRHQNMHFIYIILLANLMLFFSSTVVEIVRSRLLLHISSRVNITLISDFLIKLMKLPISFFDSKMTGDLIQRIGDHGRIQSFMSGTSLSVIFSLLNLVVFSIILLMYSQTIFVVFVAGSVFYALWIVFFLKYRRDLDYKRFQQSSESQSNLIQIIQGMQEIKLQNAEQRNRWSWEKIRAKGFHIELEGLNLSNIQCVGSNAINQFKNIVISVLTAKLVIDGQLTLGMMLSVQYIIGQLNAPVAQLLGFVQQLQDATLSLERLNEIHSKPNEEIMESGQLSVDSGLPFAKNKPYRVGEPERKYSPEDTSIVFENVAFRYAGPDSEEVLKNISFTIPSGKVTAIVGSSGSGKTTLLKLLMKFYEPTKGSIKIGYQDLKNIRNYDWRDYFGAVMQDGFIFSDSIARNIAVKDDMIDKEKLVQAVKIANIQEFIETLPLNYNHYCPTKIIKG